MTEIRIDGFVAVELKIAGAWVVTSEVHSDHRGELHEWFRRDLAEKLLGGKFEVKQANRSTSSSGVIRGIHFSRRGYQQHKWVTCTRGKILDVIVDLRTTSATFGLWDALELDEQIPQAVLVPAGLGHGFEVLTESAEVSYLLSEVYDPSNELRLNPLDRHLDLPWITVSPILADADAQAPGFDTVIPLFE